MGGACSAHGKNACIIFVGEPLGKGPLGKLRRLLEYNIKMNLKDT
jgi:hypothetical protein